MWHRTRDDAAGPDVGEAAQWLTGVAAAWPYEELGEPVRIVIVDFPVFSLERWFLWTLGSRAFVSPAGEKTLPVFT